MIFSRRDLFRGGLAGLLATSLPARAATSRRRFLFVWSAGGWDPLMAFAPMVGRDAIDMDPNAEAYTVGGLTVVDHPDRPSVRAFFDRWHSRTAILNGLSVPSVSHDICTRLALTGSTAAERADWPTLLGHAESDAYSLPSLVLTGPSYPADYGISSARVGDNGQLQALLDRSILTQADERARTRLDATLDERIDAIVRDRAERGEKAAGSDSERLLRRNLRVSLERAASLRGNAGALDLSSVYDFDSQVEVAVQALASGLCRCVSVTTDGYYGLWDTHNDNESQQSPAFEWMFSSLDALLDLLAATASPDGGTLADDTVVVVLSEMGRTPKWNSTDGRDHWPFTSAMLIGAPIVGDQTLSAFDDDFYGVGFDAAASEVREDSPELNPEHLGATLLALADVDPAEFIPNADPIAALLP